MADQEGAESASGNTDLNDPANRMDRAAAMRIMAARRRETVAQDMAPEDYAALTTQPVPPTEDADPADAAAEAERARLVAEAAAVDDAAAASEDAPTAPSQLDRQTGDLDPAAKVRMKVLGEEREVPLAEVVATAQKVAAADQYLETARQTLAEAKAMRSQFERQTESHQPTPTAAPSETSSEPDPVDVAIDSLFQGDEARAKEALRKLRGATPAPAVDADALARRVEQTMVIRSAIKQFARDHRAIMEDATLRQKADEFVLAELRTRGLSRLEDADPEQIPVILNTAGTRTKEHLGRVLGVDLSNAGGVAVNRRAEKQRIDELPTAATRAASTVPAPATTSDVIARMREARQPQPATRK